jgi:Holliday junction resolvase RusA-like endonuclease
MLNKDIKNYFNKLDQEKNKPISFHGEHDIAQKIKEILKNDEKYKPIKEDIAEQMAFDFMADYPNDNSGWETYYGPMFVLPNKDGQIVEYPSIGRVDQEMLEYWTKRAKESKNPILSSRYADLVVDFSPKALSRSADVDLFQIVIDSNIIICEKSLADPLDCKTKSKRALILATQKNDKMRTNKAKDTIIKLEKDIAIDDKPGLWGFAFKWLVLDFSKKVILENKEKNELINEIEERLKREEKNPWLAEKAVFLLAEYYAREKDEENLMRVLGILENSLKTNEQSNSNALLKTHAYEQMHEIYRKYANRFAEAEKANKRLSQEIGQLDLDWSKSLKEISVETKIEQRDIDNYLKGIFGEDKNDELEMIIAKIAVSHLPKKDTLQKQFDEIYSKSIINLIATQQILSEDKIPIAKLSTITDDLDNHFKKHALQYVQFGSLFLSLTMDELKKQFTKEKVIRYFEKSVIFENENKEYLKRAIFAYWGNDYLVSSHFFNPLIETGVRELMKIANGVWIDVNELNGYNKLGLSKLLGNKQNIEIFKNTFSKLGEDLIFYFRLVLTEKLGMNLRNDFAHGFGKNKFFTRDVSDRLFHVIICLSLVKKRE